MPELSKPTSLRCEYFVDPMAIDVKQPRLSWLVNDTRRGAKQSAYQVVVASSEDRLIAPDLWDSGKVSSDQSIHVTYAGKPLQSRDRCFWRVRTWDADGNESPWSNVARWEMGLLNRADWQAKWIASPIVGGPHSIPAAPHLRRLFDVSKPIASARLYVTALGIYECQINGQRVGDAIFAPGRTEYKKRVPYHVFDVTSHLKQGANVCGAILGDGWFCGHLHSDPRQMYGDRPRFLAQLEITCADGSRRVIATDETWQAGEGPIRSSDMLMGEDYDARMADAAWSRPSPQPSPSVLGEGDWRGVKVFEHPDVQLTAHRAPVVRKMREIKPIAAPTNPKNKRRYVFDLGQNMVGWVRLRIRNAPPGKVIDLRHAEMLDHTGNLYMTALRSARATDHYTTRGGEEEIFEPKFTFHGFRYVEVRDYPGTPTVDDVTGIVLHSDTAPTGEFECSDPLINQLQSNIVWSQRGNFIDIPTDCPQRDERMGWTGDAQVFIRTAAFNMDVSAFFTKWLIDMEDAQGSDGRIPSVVPTVHSFNSDGGPAWADAAIICPWTIYLCYGDTRILEDRWSMMARFMQFLIDTSPNFIRCDETKKWKGYGDWLSINAKTPEDLIGTAFFAHCADLMSRMAKILGKKDDEREYSRLFDDVRSAWQKRFIQSDGSLTCDTQTAYVLALHFNLLPDAQRAKVFQLLLKDIEAKGMHLSTGFVGTPYLLDVLTNHGRPDVAYALLHQKTFPSWLFPVTHGATTMWERWDGWTPEGGFNDAGMNSYNHYAYGAVGAWMYSAVAGIDIDPQSPGYKHIIIRPTPTATLKWARAKLQSIHGVIESAWETDDGNLHLKLTIPPNTTATLHLPTKDTSTITESGQPVVQATGVEFRGHAGSIALFELGAGKYAFTTPLPSEHR